MDNESESVKREPVGFLAGDGDWERNPVVNFLGHFRCNLGLDAKHTTQLSTRCCMWSVCVRAYVGEAEGLVAREILTYRAPLPAALSLASTSQRKSARHGLIYNLLSCSLLLFSCHCLLLIASKLDDWLTSAHGASHNNFFNQLFLLKWTAAQFLSHSTLSFHCFVHNALSSTIYTHYNKFSYFPSLLCRLMWLGPVLIWWQPNRACCN